MPSIKYWNGSSWVMFDANNGDSVDGIHFRENLGKLEYSNDGGVTWKKTGDYSKGIAYPDLNCQMDITSLFNVSNSNIKHIVCDNSGRLWGFYGYNNETYPTVYGIDPSNGSILGSFTEPTGPDVGDYSVLAAVVPDGLGNVWCRFMGVYSGVSFNRYRKINTSGQCLVFFDVSNVGDPVYNSVTGKLYGYSAPTIYEINQSTGAIIQSFNLGTSYAVLAYGFDKNGYFCVVTRDSAGTVLRFRRYNTSFQLMHDVTATTIDMSTYTVSMNLAFGDNGSCYASMIRKNLAGWATFEFTSAGVVTANNNNINEDIRYLSVDPYGRCYAVMVSNWTPYSYVFLNLKGSVRSTSFDSGSSASSGSIIYYEEAPVYDKSSGCIYSAHDGYIKKFKITYTLL